VIIHLLCEAFDSALLLPVAGADELNGTRL